MVRGMKTSMDRVGRVVVPKPIRDELGLVSDTEFDVAIDGAGIRLQPRRKGVREIVEIDGWPTLAPVGDRVLTDSDVLRARDDTRR